MMGLEGARCVSYECCGGRDWFQGSPLSPPPRTRCCDVIFRAFSCLEACRRPTWDPLRNYTDLAILSRTRPDNGLMRLATVRFRSTPSPPQGHL